MKFSIARSCWLGSVFLKGARLAIITNAGGPGVMACDWLIERRGVLESWIPRPSKS